MSWRTVRLIQAPMPSQTPLPCPGAPNSQKTRKVRAPLPAALTTPLAHAASRAGSKLAVAEVAALDPLERRLVGGTVAAYAVLQPLRLARLRTLRC
eukprot:2874312-Prymnesium_polylepis.1